MTETIDDMIAFDLRDRGIRDERVLAAFRRVDRRNFVPQMDVHRRHDASLRFDRWPVHQQLAVAKSRR